MPFGKNIRYLRMEYGMSLEELANKLGYKSLSTVAKWESGIAEPSIRVIKRIADIFKVDFRELATGDLTRTISNPLYEAAAGEGRINDGYPSDEYSVKLEADEVVIRVSGRSMEPTLQDGDKVVVTVQSIIDYPHQIALVKVNGDEATLKRVEIKDNGVMLIGDNINAYPPHFFTDTEVTELPVTIEGVVTKLIRDMK